MVIYNNYFHHIGHGKTSGEGHEVVAISSDVNAKYVWILDNVFYQIGGDSVHAGSDLSTDLTTYYIPNYIYVGRNTSSDNYENFIDLKTCQNVVVSQNVAYNFGTGYGTLGTDESAFRYGSQDVNKGDRRINVYTLYNTVYGNASPDGAFALFNTASEPASDEMYFIGNVVYNCHNDAGNAAAFGSLHSRKVYWYNNVAYNVDIGGVFFGDTTGDEATEKLTIVNNIFGELATGPANQYWFALGGTADSISRAVINNNIFYESGTGKLRIGVYAPTVTWTDYT